MSEHTGAGMFSGIGFATRPFDIDRLLLGFNKYADARERCYVLDMKLTPFMLMCPPMSCVCRMQASYSLRIPDHTLYMIANILSGLDTYISRTWLPEFC